MENRFASPVSLLFAAILASGCVGSGKGAGAPEPDEPDDQLPAGDDVGDEASDEVVDDGEDVDEAPRGCVAISFDYFDALAGCGLLDDPPAEGEVEGACADPASVLSTCTGEVAAFAGCRTTCESWADECTVELGALLRCTNFATATCDLGIDSVCDEATGTDLCPPGTDTVDCAAPSQEVGAGSVAASCASTNDGVCDESDGTDLCPDGTDEADCPRGSQEVASDGPGMSGGGDDDSCVYVDDGECDEPEGTDLCAEGTDVNDCAPVVDAGPSCDPEACNSVQFECYAGMCVSCWYFCDDDACIQACDF